MNSPKPPADNHVPPSNSGPCAYDDSFGVLVHFVRMGLIRHLEAILNASGLGLNFSQYRVLKLLLAEDSIKASELARRLDHDPGALTRILDRLQESGYVTRRHRQDDRRAVDVTLTEAGRALHVSIQKMAAELNAFAVGDLSLEEQRTLKALLSRVRETLER